MQLTRTSPNEITVSGNIKSTDDYLAIRKLVTELVGGGATSLTLHMLGSLSMPSSVIGFFVKLINRDKVRVTMVIQDKHLLELLQELNLLELFQARRAGPVDESHG